MTMQQGTISMKSTVVEPKPRVADKSGFQKEGEKMKHCAHCGRDLPLSAFPRHGKTKDGYSNECHECKRRRRNVAIDSEVNPLAKFTARELMHELRNRGYEGEIKYVEVKVHKMNLKEM